VHSLKRAEEPTRKSHIEANTIIANKINDFAISVLLNQKYVVYAAPEWFHLS